MNQAHAHKSDGDNDNCDNDNGALCSKHSILASECFSCCRDNNAPIVCKQAMETFSMWRSGANLFNKPYQYRGVQWCLYHELCSAPNDGVRGGIIADEMGLGKTIMMLGCIRSNFLRRTLIVLPPALLDQWTRVFQQFLGHSPFVFHGSSRTIAVSDLQKKPIVLTTYGMIAMRARKNDQPNKIHAIHWDRVIYDEAHHLRNKKTRLHKGALAIRATISWMVTGTPINNRIADLHALCTIMGTKNPTSKNDEDIRRMLAIHLLRRTKKEVGIKLPPIVRHTEEVAWESAAEYNLAADIHSMSSFSNVTKRNVNAIIKLLNGHPLAAITRMRQSCIYPQLLHDSAARLMNQDEMWQLRAGPNINATATTKASLNKTTTNSKINAVVRRILANRNNGRRKLVFSHYRGEIAILQKRAQEAGLTCETLDGGTSPRQKQQLLSSVISESKFRSVCKKWNATPNRVFNNISSFLAPEVMIVQIQTACEGLNMQHFQEIYFTSPHWNPATEDQAVARAHRIGQEQPVDVYNFVMADFGHKTESFDKYCGRVQSVKRDIMKILEQ